MGGIQGIRIAYGADYNPEQWSREVWKEDLELMRQAGVSLVSLAIFAWSELEPSSGDYRFEWLDDVMDGLDGAGIKANLSNATASPPPWFSATFPETLPVLADGTRVWPGARQGFCPSSPIYREHALRLTRMIAERYREHPALAMWHVSNEIGNHNILCYCDVSAAAFRTWLETRYRDLDQLNEAWGTSFWGQRYSDWQQILPPRQAASFGNPTHDLDFRRFSSDACLSIYRAERDVLRSVTPDVAVTTNLTPNHREFDYWSWAPDLDVIAVDHYLKAADPDAHVELAFTADVARGLAGGEPWMLMEHSTSAVNWQPRNVAKQPGEMTRNSLQHVARGADAVMFFQWRASRFGAEKYHSAMVPHAGTETKVWREVVQLGEVLDRLAEVAGTTLQAEVAFLFDWQSGWALDTPSHPSIDVEYRDQVHSLYRSLWNAGVTVDVVAPGADLSGYGLVVVPSLYITNTGTARSIDEFVAAGGAVIVTYMSGVVDDNLHVFSGAFPGAFRDVLGVRVEEFFPLREGETATLDDGSRASVWSELLHLEGAEAIASYVDGPLPGTPAVTVNEYGEGRAWYLATRLEQGTVDNLVQDVLRTLKIRPPIPMITAPAGVEATRRTGSAGSYLFLINHGVETAHLMAKGRELITGRDVAGTLALRAGAVAVVREETG